MVASSLVASLLGGEVTGNPFNISFTVNVATVQPLANTHLIVPQKSKVLDTEEINKWQVGKTTFSNL